jgi:hypothetical protein
VTSSRARGRWRWWGPQCHGCKNWICHSPRNPKPPWMPQGPRSPMPPRIPKIGPCFAWARVCGGDCVSYPPCHGLREEGGLVLGRWSRGVWEPPGPAGDGRRWRAELRRRRRRCKCRGRDEVREDEFLQVKKREGVFAKMPPRSLFRDGGSTIND